MFVLNNAWNNVVRNKGRNILIIIVVAIIAAAATIGLAIRQAAQTARDTGLSNTTVTAQISVDRAKLMSESQASASSSSTSSSGSSSSSDGKPDFESMRSALSDKQLSLSEYQKYAKASSAVKSTYYTETTSLAATDSFQPVESSESSSDSSSNSSSSSSSDSSSANTGNQPSANAPDQGDQGSQGSQGGKGGMAQQSGDFSLVGFSSDTAVENAANGSFTMTSGEVFGYTSSSDGDVIISQSLATFNNLKVGDTISVANASDSSTTYKLTVVGIYKNTSDSSQTMGRPGSSTAADPANAIYTSVSTLKKLGLDSSSDSDSAAQLSFTYVFANKDAYETFVSDVKKAGLSNDYTVQSADVEEYEQSLVPLDNLAKFALTLLIIVLAVGAIVLVALNLFNIRERKYEIGVLTAIGVNKAKVAMQFVIEVFVVTMIGLAIGVAGGAVASVPVSNQLLASQVASQQSQQASQQQQFGRGMQAPGSSGSSGSSDSSDSSGSSGSSSSSSNNAGTSTTGQAPAQPTGGKMMTRAVNYVSTVNASVNLKIVGQLILIGLALTILASLAAVIVVMRYEPLQILADRS